MATQSSTSSIKQKSTFNKKLEIIEIIDQLKAENVSNLPKSTG